MDPVRLCSFLIDLFREYTRQGNSGILVLAPWSIRSKNQDVVKEGRVKKLESSIALERIPHGTSTGAASERWEEQSEKDRMKTVKEAKCLFFSLKLLYDFLAVSQRIGQVCDPAKNLAPCAKGLMWENG